MTNIAIWIKDNFAIKLEIKHCAIFKIIQTAAQLKMDGTAITLGKGFI